MYKLIKGEIFFIGLITILFVSITVTINSSFSKGKTSEILPPINSEMQLENEKDIKEAKEVQNLLYKENGFFNQVDNKLKEKGYEYHMMLAIYSKDDIQVKYILTNKEVTDSEQEEINSIFYELVEKNNLNLNAFTLKVSDCNDGPDW